MNRLTFRPEIAHVVSSGVVVTPPGKVHEAVAAQLVTLAENRDPARSAGLDITAGTSDPLVLRVWCGAAMPLLQLRAELQRGEDGDALTTWRIAGIARCGIGADPQSDYRLCPTCVHKADREVYQENMAGRFLTPMGTVVALPPCCTADVLATPCERAYAAYNRAGDPATAGLNFRGDPCPTWDELPENIRVKWRAASDAVVMEVEDTIRAAEVEVARMGALLQAHVDEVAALRGGILHFQAQLVAAQEWIVNNQVGLQPVQVAFEPPPEAPLVEDPGDPDDAARGGGRYGETP